MHGQSAHAGRRSGNIALSADSLTATMSDSHSTPYMRTLYVGAFVVLLALGVRATFGLFMPVMGLDLGWGRDVFSLAFAIQNLVWGAGAIFMGILADRHGSGRTIALGAALYALGLVGMRLATNEF